MRKEKNMLKIRFGDMEKAIYNTEVYFKNTYSDDWISDSFAKKIIEDIDKSHVISGNLIDSPYLGKIPPTSLSGGVKTLLLIKNEPKKVFNASTCGDNCAKWLLHLAEERDITINLNHVMDFGENFEVYVLNSRKKIDNMYDLLLVASKYV